MPGKTMSTDLPIHHDPDQLRNLLLVLEHARADAWLRRDKRALEALLAPDFLEINYFGRFSRNDLLVRIFPRLVLYTFTIEGPVLFPISDGTAALTYQCYEELADDGRKMKGTFTVSALYRWNKKQWKLVLWQITPLKGA